MVARNGGEVVAAGPADRHVRGGGLVEDAEEDLAEKLDIRAKDLISRLLARGVFATIDQTLDAELASEMARFFGADTNVITFEEEAAKDVDASTGASGEEGGAGSYTSSAGRHHYGPRRPWQDDAAGFDSRHQRG